MEGADPSLHLWGEEEEDPLDDNPLDFPPGTLLVLEEGARAMGVVAPLVEASYQRSVKVHVVYDGAVFEQFRGQLSS